MKTHQLKFQEVPQLSSTDIAYQTADPRLKPFYRHFPKLETFGSMIQSKQFTEKQRQILVQNLNAQYQGLEVHPKVSQNIEKLSNPHSYTITTGHQPSLFTGPLYFIYKICSVINLTEQLNQHYPQYDFVPVYWLGGEDHDFAEINHMHLFGKTLEWKDEQGGPVGRYKIDSLKPVLQELYDILGDREHANALKSHLQKAFEGAENYYQGFFRFVHQLFEHYGLVILKAESADYKGQMKKIFKDDLLNHSSKALVEDTVSKLEKVGFKNQAYAREINLFYLLPNQRERIEKNGAFYEVLNTDLRFTETEILAELELHPERFSPNVILRPLYQEMILPNLAYIGGGGELAYWLERKSQFAHYNLPFPLLIRRNSLQFVDSNSLKKLEKLDIELKDIFKDTDQLIRQYIESQMEGELSFAEEQKELAVIFERIQAKTAEIEPTLEASVAAQEAQLYKSLNKLEGRLLRAEKKKEDVAVNQIKKIKAKLFPNDGLQERYDNFIPFYLKYGQAWLDFLVKELDPLNPHFLLVEES
jgi:bacillithiol biosynthesis cysteine-adding enzyme BshC